MSESGQSPYAVGLEKNAANYVALTPLTFIQRSAYIYPDRVAVIHGARRYTWRESYTRARRLASALKQLGVQSVRLMTNNPIKIAALESAGLDVVSDERVLGRPNAENVRYLASKRDRAGHFIDFEQMAVQAPLQD